MAPDRPSPAPRLVSSEPLRWELSSRRATTRLARLCARALGAGDLLLLSGELGAGKTFFARALCRAFGVPHEVPVTSPSFSLINEHDGSVPILHVDLYRLGSVDEVVQLGLRDRREGHLLLVEWGASWVEELGGDAVELELVHHGERRLATLHSPTGSVRVLERVAALVGAEPPRGSDGDDARDR